MRMTLDGQFGVWQHFPGAGGSRWHELGSCQFRHLKQSLSQNMRFRNLLHCQAVEAQASLCK